MADHVTLSASLLPKLEPIIGVSFALCLAYVALPRFRYRRRIRHFVSEQMGDLINADQTIKDMDIFKSASRLGSIEESDRKIFRKSTKVGELHGPWSIVYEWLFECNQDRFFVCLFAFISALLLLLGVSHDTHATSFGSKYFSLNSIGYWIAFIAFLQSFPVLCVLSGWYMTSGAQKFALKKISDIKKAEAHKAENAPQPKRRDKTAAT